MRFIPTEFRSLAFSFSPLRSPISAFALCVCASRQCIHVYSLVMCVRSIYAYMYISLSLPPLSLSLSLSLSLALSLPFSAYFCPATAARAADNVISIYIYASDRPRLSIHDGSARCRRYRMTFRHRFTNFSSRLMFIR